MIKKLSPATAERKEEGRKLMAVRGLQNCNNLAMVSGSRFNSDVFVVIEASKGIK
ncbi:hypothetical protein [Phragmitibacter flavus]|uniref:hypothetical protein n=1 Tax=Phragmitibacter flavus TaxID=2576071 RepID=UPI00140D60EE|nr:hypothetical protein [Phragmitibacter flavus]